MQSNGAAPGSPEAWMRHAGSDLAITRPFPWCGVLFEAFHAQQVAEQAIKAVLVIPLLVLLALLSGCALLDRAADLTSTAFAEMTGRDTTPVGDPLYLHLQLALLSDKVVTQILQKTETAFDAVDDPNRRAALLEIRLDYAAAMWNAASGPSPYANAIDMLLTLTVGRRQARAIAARARARRVAATHARRTEVRAERRGEAGPELSHARRVQRPRSGHPGGGRVARRWAAAGHRRPATAPHVVESREERRWRSFHEPFRHPRPESLCRARPRDARDCREPAVRRAGLVQRAAHAGPVAPERRAAGHPGRGRPRSRPRAGEPGSGDDCDASRWRRLRRSSPTV